MTSIFEWIVGGIVVYILWKIYKWYQTKQTRYIPIHVKKAVLKRYSQGGDNSEKNIVPLCPKHHAMKTRLGG